MSGVIFKDKNFWMELHKAFGTFEQGKELTEKYLFTDYDKLVEEVVVKLWKGRDAKPYLNLVNSFEYISGVKEMFDHINSKGYLTAIITCSSAAIARRVQRDYGAHMVDRVGAWGGRGWGWNLGRSIEDR